MRSRLSRSASTPRWRATSVRAAPPGSPRRLRMAGRSICCRWMCCGVEDSSDPRCDTSSRTPRQPMRSPARRAGCTKGSRSGRHEVTRPEVGHQRRMRHRLRRAPRTSSSCARARPSSCHASTIALWSATLATSARGEAGRRGSRRLLRRHPRADGIRRANTPSMPTTSTVPMSTRAPSFTETKRSSAVSCGSPRGRQ